MVLITAVSKVNIYEPSGTGLLFSPNAVNVRGHPSGPPRGPIVAEPPHACGPNIPPPTKEFEGPQFLAGAQAGSAQSTRLLPSSSKPFSHESCTLWISSAPKEPIATATIWSPAAMLTWLTHCPSDNDSPLNNPQICTWVIHGFPNTWKMSVVTP